MKKAVIGLGFGDEGKGSFVDWLVYKSKKSPLVIRFSGGQQAAHSVYHKDKNHIFSNLGSGSLRGSPTYWSKFCTMDPVGLYKEINILKEKNINPIIYIDGDSPVTTPYDKYHNSNNDKDLSHGTCGVGVGSTLNREEKYYSLTFSDLYNYDILSFKLNGIKYFYNNIDIDIDDFIEKCYKITQMSNVILTYGIPNNYRYTDDIIFEGSQGLLLDQHYGFFPNVARTNTGTKNILEFINEFEVYLITRAYQTRHGNGPMTNENIYFDIKTDDKEINIDNKYQGKFRRSMLDLSLLKYGMNKDKYIRETSNKNLVITCLDHLNEYAFTINGSIVFCKNEKEFIKRISEYLEIKNVFISRSAYSEEIEKF